MAKRTRRGKSTRRRKAKLSVKRTQSKRPRPKPRPKKGAKRVAGKHPPKVRRGTRRKTPQRVPLLSKRQATKALRELTAQTKAKRGRVRLPEWVETGNFPKSRRRHYLTSDSRDIYERSWKFLGLEGEDLSRMLLKNIIRRTIEYPDWRTRIIIRVGPARARKGARNVVSSPIDYPQETLRWLDGWMDKTYIQDILAADINKVSFEVFLTGFEKF